MKLEGLTPSSEHGSSRLAAARFLGRKGSQPSRFFRDQHKYVFCQSLQHSSSVVALSENGFPPHGENR